MNKLNEFYSDPSNFAKLASLLSRSKRQVSLRLLHYTAANAHKLQDRPDLVNAYQNTLESRGKKVIAFIIYIIASISISVVFLLYIKYT